MKDTELRKKIKELNMADGYLEIRLGKLEDIINNIVIGFCKKCKHDTIQTKRFTAVPIDKSAYFQSFINTQCSYCLTCGTLWHYEKKTVCKEVKQ